MAMGSGIYAAQNKILPGVYINYVSTGTGANVGERGIVALPLQLGWGAQETVVRVTAEEFARDAQKLFGYDSAAPELLPVREALKRAKLLLAYRVNTGGSKAGASLGTLSVSARYTGTRGNDLKVALLAQGTDKVEVVTYLDTKEMHRQSVNKTGECPQENDFVSFKVTGALAPAAATALKGGTDGAVDAAGYGAWLSALETEQFHVLAYPDTDNAVKKQVVEFVKRVRNDEGKKIVGVVADYPAGEMGIISVKNGVVLEDGTTLPAHKAAAWVAGASAAAEVSHSLTNVAYDGAIDVAGKLTRTQCEQAIKAGELVFYADGSKARVLADINSLTSFGGGVSEDWTSNRVMRTMDGWANDVASIFSQRYLGAQTNDNTGRGLFLADLVSLGKQYESMGAISDFLPEDIDVEKGAGKREVVVQCALRPNDSMEKLYMSVNVN